MPVQAAPQIGGVERKTVVAGRPRRKVSEALDRNAFSKGLRAAQAHARAVQSSSSGGVGRSGGGRSGGGRSGGGRSSTLAGSAASAEEEDEWETDDEQQLPQIREDDYE